MDQTPTTEQENADSRATMASMISVGLVLSAGGLHGAAFHAGSLGALADATGWDPRTADVIVGTSAGAATAVALRAGLAATDLAARYTGEPLSEEGQAIIDRVTTPFDLPGPARPSVPWRPARPTLLLRELLGSGRPRPVVALAGLLPEGTVDGSSIADRAGQIHPEPWPELPTWICAVDLDNGRRVVFGRDDVEADIGSAIHASSAVPGYLAPVSLNGNRYVDGGSHSTTNADLLAALSLDLVVVCSSMTAVQAESAWPDGPIGRAWHSRTLRREVQRIRAKGTAVLVLQQTTDDLAVRTDDNMDGGDRSAMADVCAAARTSTRARLAHPDSSVAQRILGQVATDTDR